MFVRRKLGHLEPVEHTSPISESKYLIFEKGDEYVKVRFSWHNPPNSGCANFFVHYPRVEGTANRTMNFRERPVDCYFTEHISTMHKAGNM